MLDSWQATMRCEAATRCTWPACSQSAPLTRCSPFGTSVYEGGRRRQACSWLPWCSPLSPRPGPGPVLKWGSASGTPYRASLRRTYALNCRMADVCRLDAYAALGGASHGGRQPGSWARFPGLAQAGLRSLSVSGAAAARHRSTIRPFENMNAIRRPSPIARPGDLVAREGRHGSSAWASSALASSIHASLASAVRSPCSAPSRPIRAVGVDIEPSLATSAANSSRCPLSAVR